MVWLLHPSHRKFVKLLHQKVGANGFIVITKDDCITYDNLWTAHNNNSTKIHKGAYKIIITAVNRQLEYNDITSIHRTISVNFIESKLRKNELHTPFRTVRNTVIYFIERFISKIIRQI